MDQPGAAAGGGAGAGGEEDIPDVRFLMVPPFTFDITVQQKEELLISFLKANEVGEEELSNVFVVSAALNRQPVRVIAMNAHAADLSMQLGRKRRHCIFLHLMIQSFGQKKSSKIVVPHRYKDIGQLSGDIKALEDGIRTLYEDLLNVVHHIKKIKGIPVKIPNVFKRELQLPNASKK